jgi:hypothetical protein
LKKWLNLRKICLLKQGKIQILAPPTLSPFAEASFSCKIKFKSSKIKGRGEGEVGKFK